MEMETRGIRGVSADNKEDDNNGKKDNQNGIEREEEKKYLAQQK